MVALEKVAGSSPVGHPSTFRIDMPNRQKAKESRYKHRGLLTPSQLQGQSVRHILSDGFSNTFANMTRKKDLDRQTQPS
jgi:hypothetical protein